MKSSKNSISIPTLFFAVFILGSFFPARTLAGEVLGNDLNEDEIHEYVSLPKLRISGEVGFSKWVISPDSISSEYDDFYSSLGLGTCASADIEYFFWPRGGFGFSWIQFISRAAKDNFPVQNNSSQLHSIHERIIVQYLGPDFIARQIITQNTMLIAGLGAGYLTFQSTGVDNGFQYKVEAHNYAIQTHVGLEYSFLRFLAVGVEGRFLFSNLTEYTYNGVKHVLTDTQNQFIWYNIPLYRFEISGGLRILF